jgi:hypothetical protein
LPKGSSKFKEVEQYSNPKREKLEEDYKRITAKVTQIKVKGICHYSIILE